MLNSLRGNISSFAARTFFNLAYARYGLMTQLKIDPENKTIDVELLLKGEREPIQIHVNGYTLQSTPDGGTITLSGITVSREWMNLLSAEFLRDRPLPIPPGAMKWARLAL